MGRMTEYTIGKNVLRLRIVLPLTWQLLKVESCCICLELAFISEEFRINIGLVGSAAEEWRGRIHNKDTLSKMHFRAMLEDLEI